MIEIPTFKILRLINDQPGISLDQLKDNFTEDELRTGRINNLIQDGLLEDSPNNDTLTLFGKAIVIFFLIYRKLLGLNVGKG